MDPLFYVRGEGRRPGGGPTNLDVDKNAPVDFLAAVVHKYCKSTVIGGVTVRTFPSGGGVIMRG
jgi:hypothetical protein